MKSMRQNPAILITAKDMLPVWLLCLALVGGLASSTEVQGAYSEDFSIDPGWTTNASSFFYWNSGSETYAATQVNVNGGGNYARKYVGHDGSSFMLCSLFTFLSIASHISSSIPRLFALSISR